MHLEKRNRSGVAASNKSTISFDKIENIPD